MTPMQRSLKKLRDAGYDCAITEHWNAFAKIRQDLFGFIDIIAIKGNEVVGVQTTSGANVQARVKKIKENEYYEKLKMCNWKICVHGWRKLKTGWECKCIEL